jgi:hypothetical protein
MRRRRHQAKTNCGRAPLRIPPAWRVLWGLLFACAASGCAGYRLGPTTGFEAGARSAQVQPFRNETPEPRLSEAVTAAVRRQVQQDGTYRLETRGGADVVVTGVLTRFVREGLAFQPSDSATAQDYALYLTARITATERVTGRVLLERELTGRTTMRIGNDLASAERQAVPLAAEDLGRRITALLVDGDW